MAKTRRIVLDVLKPHEPSMLELTQQLSDLGSVGSINTALYEVDEKVENVKITLKGEDLDFDAIRDEIEEFGGSIHSVDEVVCGTEILEESKTPQDGSR